MRIAISLFLLFSACGIKNPMPPVPTFDQQVNGTVITAAATRYARVVELGERVDVLTELNCGALKAAYEAQFAAHHPKMEREDALSLAYASDWYPAWRKAVNAMVRSELKNPDRLWTVYQQQRPVMVPIFQRSEQWKKVSTYLDAVVIPTFSQPIPDIVRVAYTEEARMWAELESHNYDPHFDWNNDLRVKTYEKQVKRFETVAKGHNFPDPLLLQWRFRRESEGGDALVSMWLQIFEDLRLQIARRRAEDLRQKSFKDAQDAAAQMRQEGKIE